ncbi:ATP-binding protein [Candidatus Margulisiibacteriota bacterium]
MKLKVISGINEGSSGAISSERLRLALLLREKAAVDAYENIKTIITSRMQTLFEFIYDVQETLNKLKECSDDTKKNSILKVLNTKSIYIRILNAASQLTGFSRENNTAAEEIISQIRSMQPVNGLETAINYHEGIKQITTSIGWISNNLHEFKNCITCIQGVQIGLDEEERFKLAVNQSISKTQEAIGILKEIEKQVNAKEIEQKETFTNPSKISLAFIIKTVVSFHNAAAFILYNNNATNTSILGFPERIKRALNNLIINSCEASIGSASILISLTNEVIEDHHILSDGNYLKLEIRDNGGGMSEEAMSKVFTETGFTTKKHGNGLGLPSVIETIKAHKGHIEISSEPGKGTTFTMYFPAADQ